MLLCVQRCAFLLDHIERRESGAVWSRREEGHEEGGGSRAVQTRQGVSLDVVFALFVCVAYSEYFLFCLLLFEPDWSSARALPCMILMVRFVQQHGAVLACLV